MPHKDRLVKNANGKSYYWNNRESVLARAKSTRLERTYGITQVEFDEMVEFQAGLCAVCCNPMKPGKGTNVDHCHVTGRVRALLCTSCNAGIGYLKDDLIILSAAKSYLEAHNV